MLQSPDDIDATYRKKRDKKSKGQVINITETANPDNAMNLLTDVTVEPNNVDDSKILNKRIDKMKAKTPYLEELHTDGGYGSEDNDKMMEEKEIAHIQTAVRGRESEVPMEIEQLPARQACAPVCLWHGRGLQAGKRIYTGSVVLNKRLLANRHVSGIKFVLISRFAMVVS